MNVGNLISENVFFWWKVYFSYYQRELLQKSNHANMLILFPLKSSVNSLQFHLQFQIIKSQVWKFCWLLLSSDPPSTSKTGPVGDLCFGLSFTSTVSCLQIRLQQKNRSVSLTVGLRASPSWLFTPCDHEKWHCSVSAGLESCCDSFVPQSDPVCPRLCFRKVSSQCLMWSIFTQEKSCRGCDQPRHKMTGEAA